jgi:hypothetical protein
MVVYGISNEGDVVSGELHSHIGIGAYVKTPDRPAGAFFPSERYFGENEEQATGAALVLCERWMKLYEAKIRLLKERRHGIQLRENAGGDRKTEERPSPAPGEDERSGRP